ncbi:MAG TPA: hypothetical protein VHN79_08635 [Lacunisphaera sp.]|nr:hypothetical protein [Lacunisphaera sp.]
MKSSHKLFAALLIMAVATIHLLNTGYADWNSGADMVYVMGLTYLFFSKEGIEDERVQILKLKAIGLAFFNGWAVTGIVRFVVYLQDRSVPPRTMSAYDVMFVTLLIALALFHWWRWQDGRADDVNPDPL